jgi:type I restriction enzyme S subunit
MRFVTINELATVVRGSSPRPQGDPRYYGGEIPRLMVSDLTRDGMYVTPKIDFLTSEGATKSRPMIKGDLILAVSGNPGEPCILNVNACIHDGFVGFRNLDVSKAYTPYLYHFFKYNKEKSKAQAVGAIFKNLNTDQIKGIKIPLPPLPQQQKIASILDAADALRQNDKALIAKYDELTQALFLDMFGDPVSNPKGWEKREILDLINPSRPVTYGILMPKEDVKPMGIPYIKVVDVKNGLILHDRVCHTTEIIESKYKRSRLKENDLLISIRGHVGRICLVPQIYINANITQDTARLDFKKDVEPLFAEYCLGSTEFQRYMSKYVKGAGVKGINLGDLKKLLLIVPDINSQKKFAEATLLLKLQKAIAQASLVKSEELFNSLLQKAFMGELV